VAEALRHVVVREEEDDPAFLLFIRRGTVAGLGWIGGLLLGCCMGWFWLLRPAAAAKVSLLLFPFSVLFFIFYFILVV
jgi:hypothetical protein